MSSLTDPLSPAETLASWDAQLADADDTFRRRYPGPPGPGPIHAVYMPVAKFKAGSAGGIGPDIVSRYLIRGAVPGPADQPGVSPVQTTPEG